MIGISAFLEKTVKYVLKTWIYHLARILETRSIFIGNRALVNKKENIRRRRG